MNFPYYIARRYLFTKSNNNAINIITIIAAVGVFAGAFSLFIVLSGFSGLRDFSLSFSNEFDPDLKVLPAKGKTIDVSSEERNKIAQISGIAAYSEIVEERVFLNYRSKSHTPFIKGVDENYQKVNKIDSSIAYGTWLGENDFQVVIGNGISQLLTLGTNDYTHLLDIMVPKPGKGQITNPTDAFNKESVVVTGIYNINEELDSKYVFAKIGFARQLLGLKENEISGVEIRLAPEANELDVKNSIKKIFDNQVIIKDRAQLNETLYKMLNTENLAVYLIFTLVLIIALFNVIGSIIMVILDKRENMKTLHSLGATKKEIRNIFFFQGTLMTVLGGAVGLFCGIILVYLQLKFKLVMITSTLPYPVEIKWINMVVVMLTISILGIIASYIAASRSKKALTV